VDKAPDPLAYVPVVLTAVAVTVVVSKGLASAVRLVVHELDYRAGDLDAWWGARR
jgi:hypothetical protein